MTVDETGVDETVVDETGVDELGINRSLQHFHVPLLRLDSVQDVVTTLCDKRGSL